MSDRIGCLVPGCRRTHKAEGTAFEWICGNHWREVPARLRRRKARLGRMYRTKLGRTPFWEFPAGSSNRLLAVRLDRAFRIAWEACKRAAIERAMGV